jgi:hypothetical protein
MAMADDPKISDRDRAIYHQWLYQPNVWDLACGFGITKQEVHDAVDRVEKSQQMEAPRLKRTEADALVQALKRSAFTTAT